MKDIIAALFKAIIAGWMTKKPTPAPTPQTPAPSTPAASTEEAETKTPNPLHAPVYSLDGATLIASRESGFVNNPANSRGRLKIILPSKYSGKVARVVCFTKDGRFTDELKRATPNEGGNRQRYYGTHGIADYPKQLWIRWDCNENGAAKDYAFLVPNPQERMG